MSLHSHKVHIRGSSIYVDPESSPASASDILDYSAEAFGFLHQSLPETILSSLSSSFIPAVSSMIIAHWLSSAIPTRLDGLDEFEGTLNRVLQFTKSIESFNWHGYEELVSWVNQAPRLWLTRRRVDSLDQVRKVLAVSRWDSRQVERVEKRQVSESDEVLLDNSTSDEWDAGWDDEKEEKLAQNDEDEDVSAWGLDDGTDDQVGAKPELKSGADGDEDEAGDAWGWGDDDDEDQPPAEINTQPKKGATAESLQDIETASQIASKEITLKENYTITDVPDAILQIIQQQIADSKALSQPSYAHLKPQNKLRLTIPGIPKPS